MVADYSLKKDSFWWCLVFSVWAILVCISNVGVQYYIAVSGLLYFLSFWQHIMARKHVPIIISGLIAIWSSYLLTHNFL